MFSFYRRCVKGRLQTSEFLMNGPGRQKKLLVYMAVNLMRFDSEAVNGHCERYPWCQLCPHGMIEW